MREIIRDTHKDSLFPGSQQSWMTNNFLRRKVQRSSLPACGSVDPWRQEAVGPIVRGSVGNSDELPPLIYPKSKTWRAATDKTEPRM